MSEPTCCVPGCVDSNGKPRPEYAHGWCSGHYQRVYLAMRAKKPVDLDTPLRRKDKQTSKVSVRLSRDCLMALEGYARELGTTRYGVITDVLEAWAEKRRPTPTPVCPDCGSEPGDRVGCATCREDQPDGGVVEHYPRPGNGNAPEPEGPEAPRKPAQ